MTTNGLHALPARVLRAMADQRGAVTSAQLTSEISDEWAARLVRDGQLVRLWRGAYAEPGRANSLHTRLVAADLTLGRRVAPCLHTAAALQGFDISGDRRVHVLSDDDAYTTRPGLIEHRLVVTAPLVQIGDRLVTDPHETALKVACSYSHPARMLAVLDVALRSGAARDIDSLAAQAQLISANRIRTVRSLVPLASPLPESPPESWLRWVLLAAGLPPPVIQYEIRTSSGSRRRRDLAWPEFKVAGEYDGVEFHTGDALGHDRARLNEFVVDDWATLHVTAGMIWKEPRALVERFSTVLRSRGWRPEFPAADGDLTRSIRPN